MNSFVKSRLKYAAATHGRIARAIAAVACVGVFSAACDVHGLSAPGTLATLVITPNPQTLAINATQQFTVVGKDFAGVVVRDYAGVVGCAGGGTINAAGMFTAGTLGHVHEHGDRDERRHVSAPRPSSSRRSAGDDRRHADARYARDRRAAAVRGGRQGRRRQHRYRSRPLVRRCRRWRPSARPVCSPPAR